MKKIIILGLVLIFTFACSSRRVTRIDSDLVTDVSGRWNDTDSRLVAEKMISECLGSSWLVNYHDRFGEKPTVIVGTVQNRSYEHIDATTFMKDIEREFVNDGQIRIVASVSEREDLRDERFSQQGFASPETRTALRNEFGADYMMMGTITSIIDESSDVRVVYYQVDLELLDIETTEKVWMATEKIKKIIE
ncbi:penicillin-binding protein activator LpoB [candidate division WOR-3 bacterium]|nr:penicillin-binding protein activator LpoB [candidate division WOR-3 bacterium]